MARQSVNDMMCNLMRSGQLGGGGRPIKTLAVVDGKTYEKDVLLFQDDSPMLFLRRFIEGELPPLPEDGSVKHSLSYIADEFVAYKIFQRRLNQRRGKEESNAEEDAAIRGECIGCGKKVHLKACARCKHVAYCGKVCQTKHWRGMGNKYGRGPEWAHKTACPKMAGAPLRVDLDGVGDDALLNSLGIDLTYGFVLVKRVSGAGV